MTRLRCCALFLVLLTAAPAAGNAQGDTDRAAVLAHLERGTVQFRGANMEAAAREWSEAIRIAQSIAAPDLEAQALARRGELYRTQGYLRNAEADLRAALARAEASGSQNLIAASSGALGNLELAAQHPEQAEPLLQRSRDLARQLGDRNTVAASANDLGNLYAHSGLLEAAASAYAEARASAVAAGDETLTASIEINAARLAVRRNHGPQARTLLMAAVDRLMRSPPNHSTGMALASAAVAAAEQNTDPDSHLAERAYNAAARTADALHDATLASLARGGLGKLYERRGRTGEASRLTDQAVFAAQLGTAPELSYRWAWQQARLAQRQGQTETALADYRRAVAALEGVRQDIPVDYRDGQSSYRTTLGPLYLEFADLLLRRAAADPAEAGRLMREARDTIEQLKESELQDYFRDSCITSFQARRQSIDTIAPGAAVLYPIAFPDRLELLVSIGSEQRQFTIPVTASVLRDEVQRFRSLLEKRTTNEYLRPARALYDRIIRPIEPLLAARQIDTLVVVPDSVLRVIPFAALHDGSRFLIERYATVVAPSLHLIDPKPLTAGQRVALVLGISDSVQGYVGLPNVLREVDAVHQIAGGKELVNAAFTQSRFAGELKSVPYNIVHIASHGQFDADPRQNFLLAYDGRLSVDQLEIDIKYGERRENALELLVLSACETASGNDRAALGLAGIALKSGARTAVASLWYVNDQAAGELVTDFYRSLESGQSKAHALQAAQRRLLGAERYAHPAYWAPFLLIGNWL